MVSSHNLYYINNYVDLLTEVFIGQSLELDFVSDAIISCAINETRLNNCSFDHIYYYDTSSSVRMTCANKGILCYSKHVFSVVIFTAEIDDCMDVLQVADSSDSNLNELKKSDHEALCYNR